MFISNKYYLERLLGRGTSGAVYLAWELVTVEGPVAQGKQVTVKLTARGRNVAGAADEFVNHSKLSRHAHVIQFREVFLTDDYLCIVMEYAVGGTLLGHVRQNGALGEASARRFFQQLMLGVDFCHRNNVALRDIRMENLLLQASHDAGNWILKLCDFGYSRSEARSAPDTTIGTLVYMAPEVIRARNSQKYDPYAADIWSCGIVLYIMLAGKYPYSLQQGSLADGTQAEIVSWMLNQMTARQILLPPTAPVSSSCHDLLRSLLEPNVADRICISEIFDHPWFACDLPPGYRSFNDHMVGAAPTQVCGSPFRPHGAPSTPPKRRCAAHCAASGLPVGHTRISGACVTPLHCVSRAAVGSTNVLSAAPTCVQSTQPDVLDAGHVLSVLSVRCACHAPAQC
jgi:serine/threonine-protein kinase SRK2